MYAIDLRLADVAGQGAWITEINLSFDGIKSETFSFYVPNPTPGHLTSARVSPLETSWRPPSYFLDLVESRTPVSTMGVIVHFSDDDSRTDQIEASASVTGAQ